MVQRSAGRNPITDAVYIACAKTYVYVKVVFSEPLKHVIGTGGRALPALFITVDDTETRLEILPSESDPKALRPNTGKKVQDTPETVYLCKYELPAGLNSASTLALHIGENTVDLAGNRITGNLRVTAPFTATETPPTVTVPGSLFIPPTQTVLSKNEKDLADFFALSGRNPTEPGPQRRANKPVDRISRLPLKDREEVYAALIAAVDLPFFAEAAETVKSRNIAFASLFIEAVKTKNWKEFNDFLGNLDREIGIGPDTIDEVTLAQIYFEENPGDTPRSKECSCYWMLLEYYRLQRQYPQLEISLTKDRNRILCLYRQSARAGNVLGLENPWN